MAENIENNGCSQRDTIRQPMPRRLQDVKLQPSVLPAMAVPNLVKLRPNTSVRVVEVA